MQKLLKYHIKISICSHVLENLLQLKLQNLLLLFQVAYSGWFGLMQKLIHLLIVAGLLLTLLATVISQAIWLRAYSLMDCMQVFMQVVICGELFLDQILPVPTLLVQLFGMHIMTITHHLVTGLILEDGLSLRSNNTRELPHIVVLVLTWIIIHESGNGEIKV